MLILWEDFPQLVGRAGDFLEIIGLILGFSGLAGPERVQRWENNIRNYLNYRKNISVISKFTEAYGCLTIYTIILGACLILSFRPVYFYDRLGLDSVITAVINRLATPVAPLLLRVGLIFNNSSNNALLICSGIIGFALSLILFWPNPIQKTIDQRIVPMTVSIIYMLVTAILIIMFILLYTVSLILFVPYKLAELLALRFNLRPVLVFFGGVITLIGNVMQSWE